MGTFAVTQCLDIIRGITLYGGSGITPPPPSSSPSSSRTPLVKAIRHVSPCIEYQICLGANISYGMYIYLLFITVSLITYARSYSNLYLTRGHCTFLCDYVVYERRYFVERKYARPDSRTQIHETRTIERWRPRFASQLVSPIAANRIINNNGSGNKRLPYDPLPYVCMLLVL